jgi:RNA polymerase sigma factor (TIGR02999 family)
MIHPQLPTTPVPERAATGLARDALFQSLYAELRRLARRELRRSGAVTLSATDLLHEAFLDMSKREGTAFPDRARFMAYAARAMRGLVIDYARERKAQKRGGAFEFTAMDTEIAEGIADDRELSRLSDALDELAKVDRALADLVDLKFFCGLATAEIAALRDVSERTVERDWTKARVYLRQVLKDDGCLG